jgi:hypothetical protein
LANCWQGGGYADRHRYHLLVKNHGDPHQPPRDQLRDWQRARWTMRGNQLIWLVWRSHQLV